MTPQMWFYGWLMGWVTCSGMGIFPATQRMLCGAYLEEGQGRLKYTYLLETLLYFVMQ